MLGSRQGGRTGESAQAIRPNGIFFFDLGEAQQAEPLGSYPQFLF